MKAFPFQFPMGLLALLLLALRLPAAAQAPTWQSARAVAAATAAAPDNFSTVEATAVDAAGNVFLAGTFKNTVTLGTTTLTSLGDIDVFVAKFNPISNQFVWAQRAGGTDKDQPNKLVVSGTSVYVSGNFESPTAAFGPVTLTNLDPSTIDTFVAKLTDAGSTGSFVWAQQASGTSDVIATALAVSGTSVYVAGYFRGPTADFGSLTLNNTNANTDDAYVVKLTDAGSTGSFVWAQRAGGTESDVANALAVNGTSVYVAGNFTSTTAAFGPVTLTNPTVRIADAYVAKLSDAGSTGSFVWAQRAGGTRSDFAFTLAVNGTSVYVAGSFGSPTAAFGSTTLANASNVSDAYVAKLTDAGSTGSFVWAQRAGGTDNDNAYALAVNGASVYVAGIFASPTAAFGSTTLANASTSSDIFVTKLSDAGSFVWAQRAGGIGYDVSGALAVSGTSVYVAGIFLGPTADFGPTALTNLTYSSGASLGFLATLGDLTPTATAAARPTAPATLFPSPARHTATLRLPAGTAPTPLVLTDALGRTVRDYPAPAGPETALDLRGLPAGLYLLRGTSPAQRLLVE